MKLTRTEIDGLLLIEPDIFRDGRGYFCETYSSRRYEEALPGVLFVQDNESLSSYGVIRGLHFQKPPYAQAKLVRCVKGRVLDVAVDIRKGSPTYGRHFAVELSDENHLQLFIPKGFAHGFSVLSETALFQYKCDGHYAPQAEGGILLNDPSLGIDWKVAPKDAILSPKDLKHPLFRDFDSPFSLCTDPLG